MTEIVSASFLPFGALPVRDRVTAPFSYPGRKQMISEWILSFAPPHTNWVDLFGGSMSMTFSKWKVPIEYINDLDSNITNFYRVLRDPDTHGRLVHMIVNSISSREEFNLAWKELTTGVWKDKVDWAWKFWYCQNAGISLGPGSWSRAMFLRTENLTNSWNTMKANAFRDPKYLAKVKKRLENVYIENRDALLLLSELDSKRTLFYGDPPYVEGDRSMGLYAIEQKNDFHLTLVEKLKKIQGMFLLSGYDSEIYKPLEELGWEKHSHSTSLPVHSAKRLGSTRVESLWVKNKPGIYPL